MVRSVRFAAACGALAVAFLAAADEPMVPRMFKGMQKGQWRAEITESSAAKEGRKMPTMILCTDNLLEQQKSAPKTESTCKRRFVKDTASEAVLESVCAERTSTVTMKKVNAANVDVTIDSKGKRGASHMKIHYTHLGACKPGQAAVSMDKK